MSDPTRETEIYVDPDVPLVRIVREFAASAALLFRAHSDPELYARWVGPDSMERTQVEVWDCRNGGEWRYGLFRQDDAYWFRGCFHEVRPGELIVQTFSFEGFPDGIALERLVFEDLDDGSARLVATSLVDSFEARDAMVASGMETGIREGYRKLDALVADPSSVSGDPLG